MKLDFWEPIADCGLRIADYTIYKEAPAITAGALFLLNHYTHQGTAGVVF
jgi:hypothetical protein